MLLGEEINIATLGLGPPWVEKKFPIGSVPGSICNTVLGGEIAFFSAGVAF